jgi:hypothetical protein
LLSHESRTLAVPSLTAAPRDVITQVRRQLRNGEDEDEVVEQFKRRDLALIARSA